MEIRAGIGVQIDLLTIKSNDANIVVFASLLFYSVLQGFALAI